MSENETQSRDRSLPPFEPHPNPFAAGQWETCLDCGWYDNVEKVDTFLRPFGDEHWICDLCAEHRGIDPS